MAQRILALDICRGEVRAALIESTFRDFRVTGLYQEDGGGDASLAERLRTFIAHHNLQADTVLVTIPTELATQRMLALPFRDRKRLNQIVPFELESHVPFGLDDVVVDYQVLQRGRSGATVLAALVQKRDLELHLATLAEAGLDPKVVDFGPLCSLNLLATLGQDLPETFAFVEATAREAAVAFYRGKRLVGVRSLLPAPGPSENGGTAPVMSAEALARELRWTLMVLNEGPVDADLPCVLAGEPSEFLTETAQVVSETVGLRVIRLESMPLRGLPGVDNGVAAGFARPLGLALREVAPATALGLNFRRGEFTYHRGQVEMRRSLARVGTLAGVVLVLVMTNLFVSYQLQQARVYAIEEQIRNVFASTVPDTAIEGSAATHLQNEIDAMQKKLGLLANAAPVGNLTAIDLLQAITTAVPAQVRIDTDDYTMDPDAVRIRGRTESFESVDALKKQLATLPYFRDIQVKDSKAASDGKGVEFRLILTLNKPGQESPS